MYIRGTRIFRKWQLGAFLQAKMICAGNGIYRAKSVPEQARMAEVVILELLSAEKITMQAKGEKEKRGEKPRAKMPKMPKMPKL